MGRDKLRAKGHLWVFGLASDLTRFWVAARCSMLARATERFGYVDSPFLSTAKG